MEECRYTQKQRGTPACPQALLQGFQLNLEQNEGASRSPDIPVLGRHKRRANHKEAGWVSQASMFLRACSMQSVTQLRGPTRCDEVTVAREACWNNNKGVRSGAFGEFGVTEAELYCKLIAQRYN